MKETHVLRIKTVRQPETNGLEELLNKYKEEGETGKKIEVMSEMGAIFVAHKSRNVP